MKRINIIRYLVLWVAIAAGPCFGQGASLSEESLLKYASSHYDKKSYGKQHQILGKLNGAEVVVDFICSDICPDYTVRVIHLGVPPGEQCTAIGGVEKTIVIPVSIAAGPKAFCVPKILADNWNSYVR
jgi:hypothetical protein